ncbi:MAG TPA: hypothetical protein VNH83_14440 [Bryobacteraceae bacterium]|nr:hypothetical protein [Bryobacteraceae bacterium]
MAGDKEIKEHPDRGQVLLDRRRRARMVLDVRRNHHGIYLRERFDPMLVAPRKKLRYGLRVRSSCVLVSDRGGKKFNEAPGGSITRAPDNHW